MGYIGTWSSVQRLRAAGKQDPMPALAAELGRAWGASPVREVRWPQ